MWSKASLVKNENTCIKRLSLRHMKICSILYSYNYSTLPLEHESSHRQYINKWAWLVSIKLNYGYWHLNFISFSCVIRHHFFFLIFNNLKVWKSGCTKTCEDQIWCVGFSLPTPELKLNYGRTYRCNLKTLS